MSNYSVRVAGPAGTTNTLRIADLPASSPFLANNLSIGSGGRVIISNASLQVGLLKGNFALGGELELLNGVLDATAVATSYVGQTTAGRLTIGAGATFIAQTLEFATNVAGNELVIRDGGMLVSSTRSLADGMASSSNRVWITGQGSTWSNRSEFIVGQWAPYNQLTISDGGRWHSGGGYIGYHPLSSTNFVLITGLGSVWETGWLYVGRTAVATTL